MADVAEAERLLRERFGFGQFREGQREAVEACLADRDLLVVMPTGAGKSLCYQLPALAQPGYTLVVSPLIALMKDQVDGLQACGYSAETLNSGIHPDDQRRIEASLAAGVYHLVFVAPERLLSPSFMTLLEKLDIRAFAIDEAHCISQWGHDFRPEYRRLATLKERFPRASVHAYTATATEQVRTDIIAQLGLDDTNVLVGRFDRPNLVYRILPRTDTYTQVRDVLRRHPNEAAIVYCITRKETETLAGRLRADGVNAGAYHAGLDAGTRRRTQDEFAQERIDVMVATVAFGMGIDRSDVRCVIHAAMPKSIEHYQQETGRAGRDGLEAECVALYSAADVLKWEWMFDRNTLEDTPPEFAAVQKDLLRQMQRYCRGQRCRHRGLSEYFGQAYDQPGCDACDVCLGEVEGLIDATVDTQKILSCVARVGQRFGIGHVVDVLVGAQTERVRSLGHDRLSTTGLMQDVPRKHVTSMVYELIDQELLERTPGDRPVIMLNEASLEVLRGARTVQLPKRDSKRARKTTFDTKSWEGVDRDLFERLREMRREIAREREVPAYVILSDATLRDLARRRPATIVELRDVYGIGERKQTDLGPRLVEAITQYAQEHPS